jgi:AraC family transcriptional regulator, carnitine catabolism transcriptional activator
LIIFAKSLTLFAMIKTLEVVFVLVPKFSMIALYGALEPLRIANRFAPEQFSWRFVSMDGGPVAASNAIPVSVSGGLKVLGEAAMVVVMASYDHHVGFAKHLLSAVRKLARQQVLLAGIDTGPFILAEAGVLDQHRATCHWEGLPGFRESYPAVNCRRSLYEIDGERMTCAGGAAAIDMMLEWIGQKAGRGVANDVADQLVHSRRVEAQQEARLPMAARFGTSHPVVLATLAIMESHVEEPLTASTLAKLVDTPLRSLERLFQAELVEPPMRIYLRLRLEQASQLLQYSDLPVRDVAVATGFTSLPVFSRSFKSAYGKAPLVWKKLSHTLS